MLEINVLKLAQIPVIEAQGRIDSMNANELGEVLQHTLDHEGSQIVLDLSGVDYMSSAGVRELVSALKKARRNNGDMRIAQPTERVMDILEMSGLDTIVQVYASRDEAAKSY